MMSVSTYDFHRHSSIGHQWPTAGIVIRHRQLPVSRQVPRTRCAEADVSNWCQHISVGQWAARIPDQQQGLPAQWWSGVLDECNCCCEISAWDSRAWASKYINHLNKTQKPVGLSVGTHRVALFLRLYRLGPQTSFPPQPSSPAVPSACAPAAISQRKIINQKMKLL